MHTERGIGLIEVIVVLAILAVSSAVVVPKLVASQTQSKELSIESDRATLKTKCSIYYLNTATHATKTTTLTSLMDADTDKFVRWLGDRLSLPANSASTLDALDKRFGWVSSQKLLDEKLLDTIPSDDRYILDTQTYTVYHVTDAEDVWNTLFDTSGSHTNSLANMTIRRFPIETSSVYMRNVNSTCMAGNTIYAGGKGTMTLAKIEISASTQTITNISSRLTNAVEVYGVSNVGSNLRVEYLNNSGKVVVTDVQY